MKTTHSFEQNELQLIVTTLQKSDPLGVYVQPIIQRLINEANTQLNPPKEVKEEAKK